MNLIYKKIFFSLCCTILSIHFIIVGFYLLPNNPLKTHFKRTLLLYINPFFDQNWHLFAPNPVSANVSLHYRYVNYHHNLSDTTQWINISSLLILEKRNSFFIIPQRFLKFISTTTKQNLLQLKNENNFVRNNNTYYIHNKNVIGSTKKLVRYGLVVYDKYLPNNLSDSVKVQYKIMKYKIPVFNNRNNISSTDFDSNVKTLVSEFHLIVISKQKSNYGTKR